MLNKLCNYFGKSTKPYCQLCETNSNSLIYTCHSHCWCKLCNDFIKDYYGNGCNNFCFLCRNPEWCKKMYLAFVK